MKLFYFTLFICIVNAIDYNIEHTEWHGIIQYGESINVTAAFNYINNDINIILTDLKSEYILLSIIFNNLNFNYANTTIINHKEGQTELLGHNPIISDNFVNNYNEINNYYPLAMIWDLDGVYYFGYSHNFGTYWKIIDMFNEPIKVSQSFNIGSATQIYDVCTMTYCNTYNITVDLDISIPEYSQFINPEKSYFNKYDGSIENSNDIRFDNTIIKIINNDFSSINIYNDRIEYYDGYSQFIKSNLTSENIHSADGFFVDDEVVLLLLSHYNINKTILYISYNRGESFEELYHLDDYVENIIFLRTNTNEFPVIKFSNNDVYISKIIIYNFTTYNVTDLPENTTQDIIIIDNDIYQESLNLASLTILIESGIDVIIENNITLNADSVVILENSNTIVSDTLIIDGDLIIRDFDTSSSYELFSYNNLVGEKFDTVQIESCITSGKRITDNCCGTIDKRDSSIMLQFGQCQIQEIDSTSILIVTIIIATTFPIISFTLYKFRKKLFPYRYAED